MRTSVRVEDPNVKGAVAEQAIVLAATELGVPVLRPVSEHGRTDLALEIGERLWRVQVKWGRLSADHSAIIVNVRTNRCTPNGYVHGAYTEREIDLFAVYCGELKRSFLIPIASVGTSAICLRLAAPRNNQQACINLADDFDFEGAVAQLGERLAGSEEARGSSPLSSTSADEPIVIGSNPLRDRFGYWMGRAAAGDEILVTHRGKPRIRLSPATAPRPS
jgi:hypothetical protein